MRPLLLAWRATHSARPAGEKTIKRERDDTTVALHRYATGGRLISLKSPGVVFSSLFYCVLFLCIFMHCLYPTKKKSTSKQFHPTAHKVTASGWWSINL
jgi:hypothetical protein